MLDPVIDFIIFLWTKLKLFVLNTFSKIFGIGHVLTNAVKTVVVFVVCGLFFMSPNKKMPIGAKAKLGRFFASFLIVVTMAWYGHYFWHASYIRNFSYSYPESIIKESRFSPGHETTAPESGTADTKSCGRSQIVDMTAYLIDFVVNENEWIPSMIQHKIGILGFVEWDKTPFFDRKSMFEKGVMKAIRRSSIELVDTLGRVRGTSGADKDLENARGLLQFDMEMWYINPFDSTRPFGPVAPTDAYYRKAIPALQSYNNRLEKCQALFDARRDNLEQYLDRISKDLGSTVDQLAKRSRAEKWDPHKNVFIPSEGNDLGWFDFEADGMFWEALGEVYAYHGLLQAAREDFTEAVVNFRLQEIWDQTESHMAESIILWPLLVSNGREDAFLMPSHLATLSQRILRARANIVEMRDVLIK